jgi:hypothetical protein
MLMINFIIKVACFVLLIFNNPDVRVIKLEGLPDIFTSDKLANIYVYQHNMIKKFNAEGILLARYSCLNLGKLNHLDVSDPMQLVLYSQEYNVLQLLDYQLNTLGNQLILNDIGLHQVEAVCKSKEGGIWLFDAFEQKLLLYSFGTKSFIRYINLSGKSESVENVDMIIEYGTNIYLHKSSNKILICDQMGGKLTEPDVNPNKNFQLLGNKLYYTDRSHLLIYDFETGTKDSFSIDGFNHFDQVRINKQNIFVLDSDSITIYPISKLGKL